MQVVSISGVQGTGKTTLARALGAALGAVVFSRDPLMKVLAEGGVPVDAGLKNRAGALARGTKGVGVLGYELQGVLLRQQLEMGHSVVLECIAPPEVRASWQKTTLEAGATFWIVDTICSDPEVHRARFEARGQGQLGGWTLTWDVAERGRRRFVAHPDAIFVADSVVPVLENVSQIVELITTRGPRSDP